MALGWNFPGGGFAFVRFFFFLIRFGQPGKEATLQVFFFFLSLSLVYLFHSVRFPSYFWVHIFFLFFFCVWFTSAGNPARTERWTVQCPLRVGRATVAHSKWAGRWRPVCVCATNSIRWSDDERLDAEFSRRISDSIRDRASPSPADKLLIELDHHSIK